MNEGALAEQFVGQEIMAGTANDIFPQAHFWIREVVGSQAEVDYVTVLFMQPTFEINRRIVSNSIALNCEQLVAPNNS